MVCVGHVFVHIGTSDDLTAFRSKRSEVASLIIVNATRCKIVPRTHLSDVGIDGFHQIVLIIRTIETKVLLARWLCLHDVVPRKKTPMPTTQTCLPPSLINQSLPWYSSGPATEPTPQLSVGFCVWLFHSRCPSLNPTLIAVSVVNRAFLAVTNSACVMSLAMTCAGVILSE